MLVFLLVSFLVLGLAYLIIGKGLSNLFLLSPDKTTPAHMQRDGVDFEPARCSYLFPQHFSAIAAAGPIVGPILAGLYFGWGPAWVWILVGSILIGGIHDFTALLASVRHRGQSVAQVVRNYMNPRAYILFLLFIWFALIYVIIAFTDVTAATFVQKGSTSDTEAPGPAVATSSILYLVLAVLMGLSLRFTRIGSVGAKSIFLPLVGLAIVLGPYAPLELPALGDFLSAQQGWGYLLLLYCFFAALAPVWLLLQPRGELGGYFLYVVMILALGGVIAGTWAGELSINQPFFKGWSATDSFGDSAPLFPILFITVACGACSGFHSIVASGTTSKQLHCEMDARPVGYGAMLMEGLFACVSLSTLMMLSQTSDGPNLIYANGIAEYGNQFLSSVLPEAAVSKDLLLKFALLCFATFVFDTLDACTRLARYVLMELMGWTTRAQAALATALCLMIPAVAIALPRVEYGGKPVPLWQVFWGIFGSSNQLLAALTLLGMTVWLARKRMPYQITLWPTFFMMTMALWSLCLNIQPYLALWQGTGGVPLIRHVQFVVSVSQILLAVWLILEAILTWREIVRERISEGQVCLEGPPLQ